MPETVIRSLCMLSCFSMRLFAIPLNVCRPPGSSVHEIPRQENWSGLPCPPPGDLPHLGIKPESPELQADSLLLSHRGSPIIS